MAIVSNTVLLRDEENGFDYKLEQDHFGVSINWKNVSNWEYTDEEAIMVSKEELKNFINVLRKFEENYYNVFR